MKPTHHTITPVPVYPIGEFADGSRLCASVEHDREVQWFPAHRDFDADDEPIELTSVDFLLDDEAPTLKDDEIRGLLRYDDDWEN